MAQLQTTVTATNGSAVVTLSDTTGIIAGKSYFKRSDGTLPGSYPDVYQVQSVVTDTSVTLTANYAGTSGTFTGLFTINFTSNYDLPLFYSGDLGTPELLSKMINYVDANMVTHSNATGFDYVRASENVQVGGVSNQARLDWDDVDTLSLEARSVSPAGPGNIELKTCNAGTVSTSLTITYEGKISTNGETAPDVDTGGICIALDAGDVAAQTYKQGSVAHPFTAHAETDTAGETFLANSANGGLEIRGFAESSSSGLEFHGFRQTLATGATNSGAVDFRAYKSDGGTGSAAPANGEVAYSFRGGSTVKTVMYGNGNWNTQGGIALNGGTDYLDEYEEGTWTPELWDSTLATETPTEPTYTAVRTGYYRRVGNIVHITGRLEVSALGSLSTGEQARIGGLPFTSHNQTNSHQAVSIGTLTTASLSGTYAPAGQIPPNTTYITLSVFDATSGSTYMPISEFSATGDIVFSASYLVD